VGPTIRILKGEQSRHGLLIDTLVANLESVSRRKRAAISNAEAS
jgi:hypothetical protein